MVLYFFATNASSCNVGLQGTDKFKIKDLLEEKWEGPLKLGMGLSYFMRATKSASCLIVTNFLLLMQQAQFLINNNITQEEQNSVI